MLAGFIALFVDCFVVIGFVQGLAFVPLLVLSLRLQYLTVFGCVNSPERLSLPFVKAFGVLSWIYAAFLELGQFFIQFSVMLLHLFLACFVNHHITDLRILWSFDRGFDYPWNVIILKLHVIRIDQLFVTSFNDNGRWNVFVLLEVPLFGSVPIMGFIARMCLLYDWILKHFLFSLGIGLVILLLLILLWRWFLWSCFYLDGWGMKSFKTVLNLTSYLIDWHVVLALVFCIIVIEGLSRCLTIWAVELWFIVIPILLRMVHNLLIGLDFQESVSESSCIHWTLAEAFEVKFLHFVRFDFSCEQIPFRPSTFYMILSEALVDSNTVLIDNHKAKGLKIEDDFYSQRLVALRAFQSRWQLANRVVVGQRVNVCLSIYQPHPSFPSDIGRPHIQVFPSRALHVCHVLVVSRCGDVRRPLFVPVLYCWLIFALIRHHGLALGALLQILVQSVIILSQVCTADSWRIHGLDSAHIPKLFPIISNIGGRRQLDPMVFPLCTNVCELRHVKSFAKNPIQNWLNAFIGELSEQVLLFNCYAQVLLFDW